MVRSLNSGGGRIPEASLSQQKTPCESFKLLRKLTEKTREWAGPAANQLILVRIRFILEKLFLHNLKTHKQIQFKNYESQRDAQQHGEDRREKQSKEVPPHQLEGRIQQVEAAFQRRRRHLLGA